MPRKFIKRHVPNAAYFREKSGLSFLGDQLHRPCLWHFNRRSVSKAVAIGLFCTWIPIPFQTIIAALLATLLSANLPLSVVLVFITNPITIPPMFYFAYRVGAWLLGIPSETMHFSFSLEWVSATLKHSWQPLLVGTLVMGVLSSVIGYIGVRIAWRSFILRQWHERCQKRFHNKKPKASKIPKVH